LIMHGLDPPQFSTIRHNFRLNVASSDHRSQDPAFLSR
jgi:hypothetical protein